MGRRDISRRKFIHDGTCGAMATTTMFSSLLNLRASGAAAMSDSTVIGGGDYKAMVCILLSGGNDSYNMLAPHTQGEYDDYALVRGADRSRGGVALTRGSLLQINPDNTPGRTFGLHPSMPHTRDMFNDGKVAFVANVGTLIESLTPQEFYAESKRTPVGLLSHSDQTQQWMTALPQERSGIGWGGRIADMVNDMNTDPNLSMNISMGGTNIFQTGVNTVEYSLRPAPLDQEAIRPIRQYGGNWAVPQQKKIAIDRMLDRTYADIYENTYINTMRSARDGWLTYEEALGNVNLNTPFVPISEEYSDITYSMGWLAKIIAAREVLGYKRQTFFVDFGGFDNHDEVINAQAGRLRELDHAMNQFQLAMEELSIGTTDPAQRVENCVTSFVISDFARTLGSNGNGTDHAWGGNVMSYGGPELINGQKIYGEYPLSLNPNNNTQDLGGGIIVPTTSADVYFAEIAKWFGVSDSNLHTIFPNLSNFYDTNDPNKQLLGFLNT